MENSSMITRTKNRYFNKTRKNCRDETRTYVYQLPCLGALFADGNKLILSRRWKCCIEERILLTDYKMMTLLYEAAPERIDRENVDMIEWWTQQIVPIKDPARPVDKESEHAHRSASTLQDALLGRPFFFKDFFQTNLITTDFTVYLIMVMRFWLKRKRFSHIYICREVSIIMWYFWIWYQPSVLAWYRSQKMIYAKVLWNLFLMFAVELFEWDTSQPGGNGNWSSCYYDCKKKGWRSVPLSNAIRWHDRAKREEGYEILHTKTWRFNYIRPLIIDSGWRKL